MSRYATAILLLAFAAGVWLCPFIPLWLCIAAALAAVSFGFFLQFKGKKGLSGSPVVVAAFVTAVFFAGAWRGSAHFDRMDSALSAISWYHPVKYTATVSDVPWYGGENVRYVKLNQVHFGESKYFPGDYVFSLAVPVDDTLRVGDIVEGSAAVVPLRAPMDPDEPDYRAINHRKGVIGEFRSLGYGIVGQETFSGERIRYGVRKYVRESLVRCGVDREAAEMTLAVVLGDKGAVDPQTRKAYQLSGAMHLLVVSGLHAAIIAAIVFGLTFFLSRRRALRVAVVLALLWGYGYLTGYSPPVVRALWMISILLLSGLGKGKYFSFGALCFAALADLAVRPEDLYSAGFQMSYAATAAVILSYGNIVWLCRGLYPPVGFVCRLVLISLAAQIALLPFILYYFGYLNLLFPIANLILVPVVSYGVIPLGLLMTVLSSLGVAVPPLSSLYNVLVRFCTEVASGISHRDFWAVSGVDLSQARFLLLLFLCAGFVVLWKNIKVAVVLVLLGGIVFCAAHLHQESPYPYLGKKDKEYVIKISSAEAIPLKENETLKIAGRVFRFLPGDDPVVSGKKSTVFVREFRELREVPAGIVLAPDAPWRSAVRWGEYAERYGVPLYDMRAKGWYKFVSE